MMSSITAIRSSLRNKVDLFLPFPNPTCYQCLRWRRKPRWLPTAPSKLFRVPERKQYPPEETMEVVRLNNNYKTKIKSLRLYFIAKTQSLTTAPEIIAEQLRKEEEHHAKCVEENNLWNDQVAELRKARLMKEAEERREKILSDIIKHESIEKEKLEAMEALVRQEKEKSNYFITAANIDEAIEKALANEVDYNYTIDIEGNIFYGRTTKPVKPEPTQENYETKIQAVN